MADLFVTLDGPRGDVFERLLGSRTVPVLSHQTIPCRLPIGVRDCYLLDVASLSVDQFWSLTEHLVERFETSIDDVQEELRNKGLPILAEECRLAIANPQKWL